METATKKLSKKAQERAWNIETIMAKPKAVRETVHGWDLISYQDGTTGRICLAAFDTRSEKPFCHYIFKSIGEYEEQKQTVLSIAKREADRLDKLQKEAKEKIGKYKMGTILYSSWGHEQTNVNFYIVMEVKGSFLKLHEIGKTITKETGFMSGKCMPDEFKLVGEPFRKKINKWGDISIESYITAWIWDGREMSFSSYA